MKIKRFVAPNMRNAMQMVRQEFGPDGIILSNKQVPEGVELVVTTDTALNETISSQEVEKRDSGLQAKMHDTVPPVESRPQQTVSQSVGQSDKEVQSATDVSYLFEEISHLRGLLEYQLAGGGYGFSDHLANNKSSISQKLIDLGITTSHCQHIVGKIPPDIDLKSQWRKALTILEDEMPVMSHDILESAGIISVVGPTGVGKTTTVAKLAARFVLEYGSNDLALITTDSYRIAAYEQLQTYADILDVPLKIVESTADMKQALQMFRDRRLILIDTAGMSQRDVRLAEQLGVLQSEIGLVKNLLALSATSQWHVLEEAVETFEKYNLMGCIITKLDEAGSLGEIVSVASQKKLPIAYTTSGQAVPEDLALAKAPFIVNEMVKLAKRYRSSSHNRSLANAYGKVVADASI